MNAHEAMTPAGTDKTGLATLLAGLCIIVGALGSELIADGFWLVMLVGFILMLYAVPRVHRAQAPADGAAGVWGARLVVIGGLIFIALAVIYLIWEAIGTPPEDGPGWANVLWPIGFFTFLLGIITFAIGSLKAKVVPPIAPALMLIGLVVGVAIDMATGAFFEDDADTTAWGFLIGVPLFGLGLAIMGNALRSGTRTTPPATAAPPTT